MGIQVSIDEFDDGPDGFQVVVIDHGLLSELQELPLVLERESESIR